MKKFLKPIGILAGLGVLAVLMMFALMPWMDRFGATDEEIANAGAPLILAPDWKPIVWSEAERKKGQAWGLKTIESFHPQAFCGSLSHPHGQGFIAAITW